MSLKLKALSLGLLAAVALSAVLVTNAGATRSGHFEVGANPTTVTGTENTTHRLEFSSKSLQEAGVSEPIVCNKAHYSGVVNALTTQEVRVTPTWEECETTPIDTKEPVTVTTNGCQLKLTSRTPPGDATAGLVCETGKKVVIHAPHSGCTLSFGSQTIANAVTYDTILENNLHSITLNATGEGITFTAHSGLCIFLGTTQHDGTLKGSVTVTGFNNLGNQVNITHT